MGAQAGKEEMLGLPGAMGRKNRGSVSVYFVDLVEFQLGLC